MRGDLNFPCQQYEIEREVEGYKTPGAFPA